MGVELDKELVERMVKWEPDKRGNCWEKCPALTPPDPFCENLGAVVKVGAPCPVFRLRVGLGRERIA